MCICVFLYIRKASHHIHPNTTTIRSVSPTREWCWAFTSEELHRSCSCVKHGPLPHSRDTEDPALSVRFLPPEQAFQTVGQRATCQEVLVTMLPSCETRLLCVLRLLGESVGVACAALSEPAVGADVTAMPISALNTLHPRIWCWLSTYRISDAEIGQTRKQRS